MILQNNFFPDLPIIGRSKYKTLVDSKMKSLKNRLSIGPNQEDIARDFSLVQNSRYLIIPNSSFSWWAAWIGTHLHECDVVAPRPWFAVLSPADENLVPKNWTVLNRELQP
jgi:hypothetical protein